MSQITQPLPVFTRLFIEPTEAPFLSISHIGLTVAHGLGVVPVGYQMILHCVIAEHGYAFGDQIVVHSNMSSAATQGGFTILADATDLTIRWKKDSGVAAAVVAYFSKTAAGVAILPVLLTAANWRYQIKAWA